MSIEPTADRAAPAAAGVADRLASATPGIVTATIVALAVMAARGANAWWIVALSALLLGVAAGVIAIERARLRRLRYSNRTLGAAERKYRCLYESAAAGVMTLSAEGRVRAANPAMLRLIGYPSESEFRRVDFADQVYAGPGTLEALLRRVRAEGELPIVELHLRGSDGTPLMAAATVRAQWDDTGAVTGYETTLLDISELKLAERQRRSIERRFRRLFDSNAVGILFGNLQRGTIDEANERLRQMLGLRASELPVLLDSLVAGDEPSLSDGIKAALEGDGHSPPIERDCARPDGRRLPVLICAAIMDPLQSEFVGVVIERPPLPSDTPAEPAALSLYASLLDAMPVLVARFNAAEQLTFCNRAYRDWFGFPAAPMGWSLKELVGVDCHSELRTAWSRAIGGEKSGSIAIEILQAGGRLRLLDITLAPHRRADGSVGGCVAVMSERSAPPAARDESEAIPMPAENTYNMSCR
jgi:PAS domain S-box-containing protein